MNERIKQLKQSKALTVLLSVLIACIMWIYVVNVVDPDINDTIHNVPISVTGQAALEEKSLMVTELSREALDVRLIGKRDDLMDLSNKNITVSLDVSALSSAGEYDLLCSVSLPTGVTGGRVSVNDRDVYRVSVTVEKRASRTVAVQGVFAGSLAKGYQGGEFTFTPSRVEVTGPESLVKTIRSARVSLTSNNLSQSFADLLPVELVDWDGRSVNSELLTCDSTMIYTVYPVEMVKDVPLAVEFQEGGGASEADITYELFPKTIRLSGDAALLGELERFTVGTVDLAQVSGDTAVVLAVALPDGLTNVEETKEVKVTVKLRNLTTKNLVTDQFEVSGVPEGYTAEVISGAVPVTVRGKEDAVSAVEAEQLFITVDLSGVEPAEGEMDVPAKAVLVQGGGAGVVGGDYSVRIRLKK